ncbi:MAG: trypsin-like peptidase domain-containing protein [Bacteroidota bacterium]
MKKLLLFSIVLSLGLFLNTNAQVSIGGKPFSFTNNKLSLEVQKIILPKVDLQALLAEDEIESHYKDIPYRFGIPIDVNLNLQNSGTWENLANGDRIWRLNITSKNALSLNINYDNFYMPEGGKLYIYSADKNSVIGAFTNTNNKTDGKFATGIIPSSSCYLEYYEPASVINQGIINISKVIHGYRDVFSKNKGFGSSGSCNNNVNCPEGNDWQTEKRAVAMILTSDNSRICTGSMINNVRQDGTQYFLTANHCLGGETTWIFMFNYESPSCTSADGPTTQTVQGATLKANNSPSDFALLEITEAIPPSYNVHYAGWSSIDIAADSVVGIHHPAGDVKKITFDYGTVSSSNWSSGVANSHWTIANWEDGTTEGGSSGSPLFNRDHRIIGQLHGGGASCSSLVDDNYGKFAFSWSTDPTNSKQLKFWLDPDNTGETTLNGKDFNIAANNVDAAMKTIESPTGSSCETSVTPIIYFKNNGANALTSVTVNYQYDNTSVQTVNWTGNLAYFAAAQLTLPNQTLAIGNHTLKVYVSSPNGSTDENLSNDTLTSSFSIILGGKVTLTLTTDGYPDETIWDLKDSLNTIIASGGPMTGASTAHTIDWCLSNGCYKLTIYDSYGDGMGGGFGSAAGSYTISRNGVQIASGIGNFTDSTSSSFCINNVGIDENEINTINIYPNPTSGQFNIDLNSNKPFTVCVFNSFGALVIEKLINGNGTIDLSNQPNGIYYIRATSENAIYQSKVVLNK